MTTTPDPAPEKSARRAMLIAFLVVSIEGLEEGAHILAKDVVLPSGSTLVTDPETLVLNVTGESAVDLGEEPDA